VTRLKVGIAGCGLVTQVEHLPNLLALPDLFEVIAVADPSATVRTALSDRHGVRAFESATDMMDSGLDAVVIATPDSYHADLAVAALERGLHVFSEKPLSYGRSEIARIAAARERAGRVVQVGYMKRFDPAYRMLCDLLGTVKGPLRAVTVDVLDSDAAPFVAHHDLVVPKDVPPSLIAESAARRAAQVKSAIGSDTDPLVTKGFSGPYSSSLVHDLNLVQGLLDAAQSRIGRPLGAAFIAGDSGGYLSATLEPSDGVVTMIWVATPKLAYYSERIMMIYDDRNFELRFPSPYLNHHPTELIERRANGHALEEIRHRPSYAEPFVEEAKGWHASIVSGAQVVNTIEQAAIDMGLLAQFAILASTPTTT
jgi:predicted dehydrogenase